MKEAHHALLAKQDRFIRVAVVVPGYVHKSERYHLSGGWPRKSVDAPLKKSPEGQVMS